MTFDYELSLLSFTYSDNDIGDSIKGDPVVVDVLCDVQSVKRSEHYAADANGLKPEIVFIVSIYDYEGQKKVMFDGKTYNVIREYRPRKSKNISDFETLELICEGAVNHGSSTFSDESY